MNIIIKKPDSLGVIASALCFLHCLTTPLIFIIQANNSGHSNAAPFWWKNMDFIFLLLGFMAIYQSSKTTSKTTMKILLWLNWLLLFFLVINEKMHLIHIPELIMYTTALSLSAVHIYNLKYCKCKEDTCCASNHK